ncbi:unnamed protein product [Phaeothamnion confervicola]
MMSLVDTSVVGLRSSLELAALGPATTVCDSLLYCFAFLAVATTNLLATALADKDETEAQRVVSHALAIAVSFGVAVLAAVQLFAPFLLRVASGGSSPALIPPALLYTRFRILSAPFCLGAMVAQAALLGAKDSLTPLTVVLITGGINAVGDLGLAWALKFGIAGAAVATAASDVVSMALLGRALQRMQGVRRYPFMRLPNLTSLRHFLSFAGPVFFALLMKVICYSSMTNTAAGCGNVQLASHNVMLRIFFFFTTFGDSLSQTAQAFLPGMLSRDADDEARSLAAAAAAAAAAGPRESGRVAAARAEPSNSNRLIRKLLWLALGVGTLNASFAGLLPCELPMLFTKDALIVKELRALSPLLSWSLLSQALVMSCEGILLAKRELSFLAGIYLCNTMLMLGWLRSVRRWGPGAGGLHGVWFGLLGFQALRFVQFGLRLMWVKRRERAKAREARQRAFDAAFAATVDARPLAATSI